MWETRSVFHISMPRLLRQDCLRCWWPITQCRVRPLRVVFHAPPLGQNLCLLQRVKDLAVQELIAQLSVEALTIPVFPRTPRLDVQRPRAHFPQPLPQLLGNKLRSVVRTNVLWYSARQHHIGQRFDHLQTPQPPRHPQCQALPCVLVDHHQDAQYSSVVRHRLHKVVAPHMIRPLRSQPHTRTITEPHRPRGRCFCGTFSPSRRQIRCTRSLPTSQPRSRSKAVIRRYPYRPYALANCRMSRVSSSSSSRWVTM